MYTDSRILKSLFYIQLTSSFLLVVGHFTASAMYFAEPFWMTVLNQISRYGTVLMTIATGYLTAYTLEKKQPSAREDGRSSLFCVHDLPILRLSWGKY